MANDRPQTQIRDLADALFVEPEHRGLGPEHDARVVPIGPYPATVGALLDAIARTRLVVEGETAALAAFQTVDFAEVNRKKTLCVLELGRALKSVGADSLVLPGVREAIAAELAALKGALADNSATLSVHIDVMQQVSSAILQALRNFESDGTYPRRP